MFVPEDRNKIFINFMICKKIMVGLILMLMTGVEKEHFLWRNSVLTIIWYMIK